MALIKRYTNRKLYHSEAGRYVTLEDIVAMVRRGEDVRVVEHASGRDLTTAVLLQAVLEEEKRLGGLIPRVVLTRLLQNGEETMSSLRAKMLAAFDPQRQLEEGIRARIERLVARGELGVEEGSHLAEILLKPEIGDEPDGEAVAEPPDDGIELDELRRQVDALEQELHRLQSPAQSD